MNKIISANINGFVFQIDELAYAKLKAYLDTIKQKVVNTEVAQDIENRIAELFNQKLQGDKTAIFDVDVDDVMHQIGKPEEISSEENESENTGKEKQSESVHDRKKNRRLYRDEDDKVIGGVCSGIAAYFGLDPVVIRLAFAASFLFFGTGFLLYILLMIIIPKAQTPSEKLEMRGEPIDYKNVSKTVEREFKDAYQRYKPEMKTGFERFIEIMVRIGMIVLLIFLVSIFIPGCFGIITGVGVASWALPTLDAYMFTSHNESMTILIGLFLFLIVPIIGIGYQILRFGFKLKPMGRFISIPLTLIWFTGFAMLAYSTYNIGMQFSSRAHTIHTDTLQLSSSNDRTLVLRCNQSQFNTDFNFEDDDDRHVHIENSEDLRDFLDQRISERVKLAVVHGFSDKPVIKVKSYSNGPSKGKALSNAEMITYHYEMKDSLLYLDDAFILGQNQLWRNQKVLVTVELPESYRLYIDRSCRRMLDVDGIDEDKITNRFLRVGHNGIRVDKNDF